MKYFALLTTYGEKVLAEATALGTKIELTHMSVGDGGGSLPAPDTKQTKLINERRKAAINTLFIDPVNPNQIIAEQVIPENEGGWWIREIGLFDKSGMLVAVANAPETYKPTMAEGSGRTQTIRMILIVSHTETVTLKIDPTVVLATRKYVDDAIQVLDKRISDLTASDVGAVPVTRKVNGKPLSTDITLNSSDVGSYSKAETDTRVADAKKAGTDAQSTANAANTNANSRVPSTRKVNGKPLSEDISLGAGDVGSYTKAETDTRVADAKKAGTDAQATANAANTAAANANTAASNANNNANGRVPSTRKVNGKPLSTDITLNASDVGALTQAQADALYPSNKRYKVQGHEAQVLNGSGTHYLFINDNVNSGVYGGTSYVWGFNGDGLMTFGLIPTNCGGTGARDVASARNNLQVYSRAEVDSKIKSAGISAVRLGSEVSLGKTGAFSLGNGEVVTGLTFWETGSSSSVNFGGYRKRAIQYNLNGTWVNAASV
ncbi:MULTISPECIES: phage tail protein [unclassified Providencia]|uniref:phage tail protein n=1 Tax=unclassified Providencia TaxID=2633465 RepID=UPI003C2AD9BE